MKTHTSEHPSEAIFASMHPVSLRHQGDQLFGEWDSRVDFVVTHDYFVTHRVLVPRGNRFLFSERYLSVAQVNAFFAFPMCSVCWGRCGWSLSFLFCSSCLSITYPVGFCLFKVVDPKDRPAHVTSDVLLQVRKG